MAFELLLKDGVSQHKATQILDKLGETSFQQFNACLVASWIGELDNTITEIKDSIADKIHRDLFKFEHLYQCSVNVQTRLHDITSTVNSLEENLESPYSGILPNLAQTLASHSTRERLALEAEVTHRAFEQLFHLGLELQKLCLHMNRGELLESTQVCHKLDSSILAASTPLRNANIMLDMKKRLRSLRDNVQEQLSNAYDRCISFSDQMIVQIHHWTVVSSQLTSISLPTILSSLSRDALSEKLTAFRRDLLTNIVDPVFLPPHVAFTSAADSSAATFSAVSFSESASPVQTLRLLSHFLLSHLLLHLPENQADFVELLFSSLGSSLLTKFLQPSIPSSLPAVPFYLSTLNEAISFETEYINSFNIRSRPWKRQIREWGDGMGIRYATKRREFFLGKIRSVMATLNDNITFRVEMTVKRTISSPPMSRPTTPVFALSKELKADGENVQSNNWEFNNEESEMKSMAPSFSDKKNEDEDRFADDNWGWGDDEIIGEPQMELTVKGHGELRVESSQVTENPASFHSPDVEFSNQEDIDPWDDDPWAVPENTPEAKPPRSKSLPFTITAPIAKVATRLEKFSAKSKSQTHNERTTPGSSQAVPDASPLSAVQIQVLNSSPWNTKAKTSLPPKQIKEAYFVTLQARRVLEVAGEVLREGKEMFQTSVFSDTLPQSDGEDKLGQLLLNTALSTIDLYRALYPITQAPLLSKDPTQYMQWSNDCLFLSQEMSNFKLPMDSDLKNKKWLEAQDRTRVLGECCFEDAISRTRHVVRTLLAEANGFLNVSNNDQFETCKDVVSRILGELEGTAHKWKKILSKSRYFISAGRIVEDTLYHFMDQIISLQDIPQKDSEYISGFCEMLERLGVLFVYASGEQSVVGVYVSIWFKFSYFSWLIKGSIVDISYMFDQGHLIDYEIDELVRLLRALFADTPLRHSTIHKFFKGHSSQQLQ